MIALFFFLNKYAEELTEPCVEKLLFDGLYIIGLLHLFDLQVVDLFAPFVFFSP